MDIGDAGTLTTGWVVTSGSGWTISASNYCQQTSTSDNNYDLLTDATGSADSTGLSVTFTTPATGTFNTGLAFRVADASNHWMAILGNGGGTGGLYLYKKVAGSFVQVGLLTGTNPLNATSYTITAVLSGSSIAVTATNGGSVSATDVFEDTVQRHGLVSYSGASYTNSQFTRFEMK